MQVPFNIPEVGADEIAEVSSAISSGWLTSGPKVNAFEAAIRDYCGAKFSLAVNSCTAGLHLSLKCLDLQPGDEVITTPLTFCATVNTIIEAGGVPVLADIGDDYNISASCVEACITPRTRAIVPVHFAGLPCEMDDIWALARSRGLRVVEDAAHAVGAEFRGVRIGGGCSDAVVFSFYATKNICTGEGGMICCNDEELFNRMKVLCLHGISRDAWSRYSADGKWFYDVLECGFKYNLSEIAGAMGIAQMRKFGAMQERRREIARIYREELHGVPGLVVPPTNDHSVHAWHLYVLRINEQQAGIGRDQFIVEMKKRGVQCSVHFIPIPMHSYYRRIGLGGSGCEKAIDVFSGLVSLPLYPGMSMDAVGHVVASVKEIMSI